MSHIKIAFLERNPFWQRNLTQFLEKESDLKVIGHAESKEQGKQLLESNRFDIVLLNQMLTPPDCDGLDLAREMLNRHSFKIIIIASEMNCEWISSAIQAGVKNIVPISHFRELPNLIREAHFDHEFLHTHTLQYLRDEINRLKKIEGQ